MKFSDGFWQMRPGVTPHYAVQVHEIEVEAGALTVHAATRRLASRGDMLDGPMLSVRFSSPLENVIRVQVVHFKGGTPLKPEFELNANPQFQPVITQDEESATLTSGQLSVRVQQAAKSGGWSTGLGSARSPPAVGAAWASSIPPRAGSSTSSWTSAWGSACTGWGSASRPSSRTGRSSTCGTPTAAPAASRRTRTSPST